MIRGHKTRALSGIAITTDRKCPVRHFCDFYDATEYDQALKDTFVCVGCSEKVDVSAFRFVDLEVIKSNRNKHASDGWC